MATKAQIAASILSNILSGGRRTTAAKIRTVLDLLNNSSFNIDDNPTKGLSTNDFTDALETKLNSVESNAQVNIANAVFVGILDATTDISLSEVVNTFTDITFTASDTGEGLYRITADGDAFTDKTAFFFSVDDAVGLKVTYTSTTIIDLEAYDTTNGTGLANGFSDLRFKIEVYP